MTKFYDTSALLNILEGGFKDNEKFYISSITLKELEGIKTNPNKDPDTKYKARQLVRLLNKYPSAYEVIYFTPAIAKLLKKYPILSESNDSYIILSALSLKKKNLVFYTDDILCKFLAKACGLIVDTIKNQVDDYKGYKVVTCETEEELAHLYEAIGKKDDLEQEFYINEYLFIKNKESDEIIDLYKYTEDGFIRVQYQTFESDHFGKLKPKDAYQKAAMDSLSHNQITLMRGKAGSGKTLLGLSYLMDKLEHHKIDKIVIFCNPIAVYGAAKLGFYPGSKDEKLLDSQIGNILSSKLGSTLEVERMIKEEQLELIPMSDLRGFDSTGLRAGIFITEAQNMQRSLMKLALQRVGEDSICVIEGDDKTQLDAAMYAGDDNGMRGLSKAFRGDKCYGEITLEKIHRSHIANLAENI